MEQFFFRSHFCIPEVFAFKFVNLFPAELFHNWIIHHRPKNSVRESVERKDFGMGSANGNASTLIHPIAHLTSTEPSGKRQFSKNQCNDRAKITSIRCNMRRFIVFMRCRCHTATLNSIFMPRYYNVNGFRPAIIHCKTRRKQMRRLMDE